MFIAVVQFNPKVGALRENCERALAKIDELAALPYPPDLVIFPAYALSGAELGGLVAHNAFAAEALDVAQHFINKAALPTLIGTVLPRPALAGTRFVCEEEVLFAMGGRGSALGFLDFNSTVEMQDYVESIQMRLCGTSITIVLDDFVDPDSRYTESDVIITLLARPYQETNGLLTASNQIDSLRADAIANDAWIVVANLCGGEDAFVYEGASLVIAPNGSVIDSSPPFEEDVFMVNLSRKGEPYWPGADEHVRKAIEDVAKREDESEEPNMPKEAARAMERPTPSLARKFDKKRIIPLLPYEATWRALSCGVRDYVRKNGFEGVVLGLSGGIDSALVAALAVDALGAEQVHGVMMPSPFSSKGSLDDAEALAANLGIETLTFPISQLYENFLFESERNLETRGSDLANQNLQARLRMLILMHLSNTHGWLLLSTGNKSEAAVGYSTLYGDMAGAIAPFGAIYKTDVYGLATWRNSRSLAIPQAILDKEPSAELCEGQKDTDALPPYEVLDQILRLHIEEGHGVDEILEYFSSYPIKTDVGSELILDVLARVRRAEFKRHQGPLLFQFDSVDITQHRAWPITNGFEDHSRDIIAPAEILSYLNLMYREVGPSGFNFLEN